MDRIIDAHHHLWKYNREEYSWIDDTMEILRRDYLPEDLLSDSVHSRIAGTVVVQARQTVGETEWLLSLAEANPLIMGVVGWLDLRGPGLENILAELSVHPKLVGLRHVLQDEKEIGFMLQPSFTEGLALVGSHQLTYDLLIFHHQMEEAIQLVSRFPDQKFVLDHMAKPPVRTGNIHPWKERMEQLAGCSNVWCKISGLVTEADHFQWSYDQLVPYMEVAVQAFGPERIMVGSDWPVCRLAAEYPEVMSIPGRFFADWDSEERYHIFFQNAVNCYELEA